MRPERMIRKSVQWLSDKIKSSRRIGASERDGKQFPQHIDTAAHPRHLVIGSNMTGTTKPVAAAKPNRSLIL